MTTPCEISWCAALAMEGREKCAVHERGLVLHRLQPGSPLDVGLGLGGETTNWIRQMFAPAIETPTPFPVRWADQPRWLRRYGLPTDA